MSTNVEMKRRLDELLPAEFWQKFGGRLGDAIARRKKKPAHIARYLECSPAHISKAVSTGSISLQAITAICLHLNVSLDELVFGNKSRLPVSNDPDFKAKLQDWLAKAPPELLGGSEDEEDNA